MRNSDVSLVVTFCITVIIIVSIMSATALVFTYRFGDRNEIQTAVAS